MLVASSGYDADREDEATIEEAKETLGDEYKEQPLFAPAGEPFQESAVRSQRNGTGCPSAVLWRGRSHTP